MTKYTGSCHCGSIHIELNTETHPGELIAGECQCSFCRKHNARAFSSPNDHLTITACNPNEINLYEFGLKTSKQIICRRCGVYVAMLLIGEGEIRSVVNIDVLDERARFVGAAEPRNFDSETRAQRLERRKSHWMPTSLVNWSV